MAPSFEPSSFAESAAGHRPVSMDHARGGIPGVEFSNLAAQAP